VTDIPTTSLFTADTITDAALEVAARPGFWTGYSGEPVTGEDVASHLDATLTLLEKRGWSRTYSDPDPELPEVDETASVKTLLIGLVRAARDMCVDRGPLTLSDAMGRTQDTDGDQDTSAVADHVMDALLRARTGASFVSHGAWVSKRRRIWGEVRELLTAAAAFARTHGPR
jgi:hypothetical protein